MSYFSDLASNMVRLTKRNDGFTLGAPRAQGFIVGGVVPTLTIADDAASYDRETERMIVAWLETHREYVPLSTVGGWREAGVWHFDLGTFLPFNEATRSGIRDVAHALATERGEKAIAEQDQNSDFVACYDTLTAYVETY